MNLIKRFYPAIKTSTHSNSSRNRRGKTFTLLVALGTSFVAAVSLTACSTPTPNEGLLTVASSLEQISVAFNADEQSQMKALTSQQYERTVQEIETLCREQNTRKSEQNCSADSIMADITILREQNPLFPTQATSQEVMSQIQQLQEYMLDLSSSESTEALQYLISIFAAQSVATQYPTRLDQVIKLSESSVHATDYLEEILDQVHSAIYGSGIALAQASGDTKTSITAATQSLRRLRDQLTELLASSGVSKDALIAAPYYSMDPNVLAPYDNITAAEFMHALIHPITMKATNFPHSVKDTDSRKALMSIAGITAQAEAQLDPTLGVQPLSIVQRGTATDSPADSAKY